MHKIRVCGRYVIPNIRNVRFLSSATRPDEPLFPRKDEFPNRHIGPRDRDIITMLDTLGFKVRIFNFKELCG